MKDQFTREWITENALNIVSRYEAGVLTLRGLHYQLVGLGMTNSLQHYKRVVSAMIKARREGVVDYEAFSDHDRAMIGETQYEEVTLDDAVEEGKRNIRGWMNIYSRNRWENQPVYPEVFIEKKALQGVFGPVCTRWNIALGACKGYPSLTFLNDASLRFYEAAENGKQCVILYFGDYDPSGEDIPRSIEQNLLDDFGVTVDVKRIALLHNQVVDMGLPPAPVKVGDSRTANWNGLGQVELDAIPPETLQDLCEEAIRSVFDEDKYDELVEQEDSERETYRDELKSYVRTL